MGQTAAHTPGPWAWDDNLRALCPVNFDPERSAVHTILTNDGTYGFLGSDHKATEAEYRACCRVIAAAPSLLDELIRLVQRCDTTELADGSSLDTRSAHAAIALALAAPDDGGDQ